MEIRKAITKFLEKYDAKYSTGVGVKCKKYKIADIFDPVDD